MINNIEQFDLLIARFLNLAQRSGPTADATWLKRASKLTTLMVFSILIASICVILVLSPLPPCPGAFFICGRAGCSEQQPLAVDSRTITSFGTEGCSETYGYEISVGVHATASPTFGRCNRIHAPTVGTGTSVWSLHPSRLHTTSSRCLRSSNWTSYSTSSLGWSHSALS